MVTMFTVPTISITQHDKLTNLKLKTVFLEHAIIALCFYYRLFYSLAKLVFMI